MQKHALVKLSSILIASLAVFILPLAGYAFQPHPARAASDLEDYTYRLSASTAAYQLWTAPPSERVFTDSAIPNKAGSEIKVYAARNEFEPFQLIVNPSASGSLNVSIGSFGAGIEVEIYQVKYVNINQATDSLGRQGPYPDPLWPVENGAVVPISANQNTAFWFNIHVPSTAASQDYITQVILGGTSVPIRLHVFNFAIPAQLHVDSQMNFSYQAFLAKYSVPGYNTDYWNFVDHIKEFFIDHRLTPTSILWPGGLTGGGGFAAPFIDYNCSTHTLIDNDGIWGFVDLAQRYIDGTGLLQGQFSAPFNAGTGFPAFMAAGFANNDPSIDQRPATFCGYARSPSDWLANPESPYNQAWFSYVTALQNELGRRGYLEKSYHYFANEPQDLADYNAVAWYSRYSHQAAPNLKLMVSEEPRPEIYDQAGAHVDIWLPVLQNYDPLVSHDREINHGELTWIYFLDSTRPPYFNPITLDHPGIEARETGWFLWKYRLRGLAYYSLNDWSANPWIDPWNSRQNGDTFMLYPPSESNQAIPYGANNLRLVPSIRFELLRDGLEDYEYLYQLNGGRPVVGQPNIGDNQADKIISGLTAYSRDSEFLYNLRRLIGLKIGGEIPSIPDIHPGPAHPRAIGLPGNYYINFQDPAGEPTANPLVVNGKTYLKIGANDYSALEGYGWFAPPDANWMTSFLSNGPNVLQRSVLYSDWGRPATWEFDLPNGVYNVTLSVGWQGGAYSHQKAVIEGIPFINDEATTPDAPYLVRTRPVVINDHKLTLEMGIFDEYTILNYLDIEASAPTGKVFLPLLHH